ncbi:MAG: hypothetical protein K6T83_23950, partial [Alicyclobacillus sp.]|nr:hypothetical protein [Alicyclobacillus sp.]
MNSLKPFTLSLLLVVVLSGCSSTDKVTYHNRTYIDPSVETINHLTKEYGTLVPTGERVDGLQVYDTKRLSPSKGT